MKPGTIDPSGRKHGTFDSLERAAREHWMNGKMYASIPATTITLYSNQTEQPPFGTFPDMPAEHVMTDKAAGVTYAQFVASGCTDDFLRSEGYML